MQTDKEYAIRLAMEYGFTGGFDSQGILTYDSEFVEAVLEATAKEREYYEGVLTQICAQCRSNEWGPLTHKKEILNWFHDFAASGLERGEAR